MYLHISRLYPTCVISVLQGVFLNESVYSEAVSDILHLEDFAVGV